MCLYALTKDNSIREFVCDEQSLKVNWRKGCFGFDTFLAVGQVSKIAALRPQYGTGDDCCNFFPQMAIAYQNEAGVLMVAKLPKWPAQSIGVAVKNTVIGMPGITGNGNITDHQWRG